MADERHRPPPPRRHPRDAGLMIAILLWIIGAWVVVVGCVLAFLAVYGFPRVLIRSVQARNMEEILGVPGRGRARLLARHFQRIGRRFRRGHERAPLLSHWKRAVAAIAPDPRGAFAISRRYCWPSGENNRRPIWSILRFVIQFWMMSPDFPNTLRRRCGLSAPEMTPTAFTPGVFAAVSFNPVGTRLPGRGQAIDGACRGQKKRAPSSIQCLRVPSRAIAASRTPS